MESTNEVVINFGTNAEWQLNIGTVGQTRLLLDGNEVTQEPFITNMIMTRLAIELSMCRKEIEIFKTMIMI